MCRFGGTQRKGGFDPTKTIAAFSILLPVLISTPGSGSAAAENPSPTIANELRIVGVSTGEDSGTYNPMTSIPGIDIDIVDTVQCAASKMSESCTVKYSASGSLATYWIVTFPVLKDRNCVNDCATGPDSVRQAAAAFTFAVSNSALAARSRASSALKLAAVTFSSEILSNSALRPFARPAKYTSAATPMATAPFAIVGPNASKNNFPWRKIIAWTNSIIRPATTKMPPYRSIMSKTSTSSRIFVSSIFGIPSYKPRAGGPPLWVAVIPALVLLVTWYLGL